MSFGWFCISLNFLLKSRLSLAPTESHTQWGRPGGPQGAVVGGGGEETEGEGNSLINQTVAMAIAGTSTPTPMSRPSSFLLNSQVAPVSSLKMPFSMSPHFIFPSFLLIPALRRVSRRLVSTAASWPSPAAACSSVCCGC